MPLRTLLPLLIGLLCVGIVPLALVQAVVLDVHVGLAVAQVVLDDVAAEDVDDDEAIHFSKLSKNSDGRTADNDNDDDADDDADDKDDDDANHDADRWQERTSG